MADLPALTYNMGSIHTFTPETSPDNNTTPFLTAISSAVEASTYWQVTTSSIGTDYPAVMIQPKTTGESYSDQRIVFVSGMVDGATDGVRTADIADNVGSTHANDDPFLWMGMAASAPTASICSGTAGDWRHSSGQTPFAPEHRFSGWHPVCSQAASSYKIDNFHIVESAETFWVYAGSGGATSMVYNSLFGAGAIFVPFRNLDGHSSGSGDAYRGYGMVGGSVHPLSSATSDTKKSSFYYSDSNDIHNPAHVVSYNDYSLLGGSIGADEEHGGRMYAFLSASIDGNTPDDAWRQLARINALMPDVTDASGAALTEGHRLSYVDDDGNTRFLMLPLIYNDRSTRRVSCYLRQVCWGPQSTNRVIINNSSGSAVAYVVARNTDTAHGPSVIFHNQKTFT